MTAEFERALAVKLDALLEAQRATARAMERIADVLDASTRPDSDGPALSGCTHPVEQRMDFGVTDGREDWRCRACGYSSLAPAGMATQ